MDLIFYEFFFSFTEFKKKVLKKGVTYFNVFSEFS